MEGGGGRWREVEGGGGRWRVVEGREEGEVEAGGMEVEGGGGRWREVEGGGGGGGRWREVEGGGGRWREVEGGGGREEGEVEAGGMEVEGGGGRWREVEGGGGRWRVEGGGGRWRGEGGGGGWRDGGRREKVGGWEVEGGGGEVAFPTCASWCHMGQVSCGSSLTSFTRALSAPSRALILAARQFWGSSLPRPCHPIMLCFRASARLRLCHGHGQPLRCSGHSAHGLPRLAFQARAVFSRRARGQVQCVPGLCS